MNRIHMPKLLASSPISFLCCLFLLSTCQITKAQNATETDAVLSLDNTPYNLRIELLLGQHVNDVFDANPSLSWELNTPFMQTAYQVNLYQLLERGKSKLIWDSGKVETHQSYAKLEVENLITDNTTYKWRVKTWLVTPSVKNPSERKVAYKNKQPNILASPWSDFQTFSSAQTLNRPASEKAESNVSTYQQATSSIAPKSIEQLPSGNFLIDFGKVAFGYLQLHLSSDKQGQIDVILAERGNKKGAIPKQHPRSSVRYYEVPLQVNEKFDTYRVNPPKDKRNTRPDKAIAIPGKYGRITPFRFVEIKSNGLRLSDISAVQIAIHYPFNEFTSSFTSSDELLNQIWDLSKYSMKATSFAGVYVDGDRERIPYEADAYINQLSHYAVDNQYSMARKTLAYLIEHPTWPTEWKQHSIMMAWMDWMYTGDLDAVKQNYAVLKQKNLLSRLARTDGLLISHPNGTHSTIKDIVDWPIVERDGFEFKDVNTVVNAFHYLNLKQMAEFARLLGLNDDADEYAEQASLLYSSFNKLLFNPKTGLYIDGEGSEHSAIHANILPLVVGLVPQQHKQKIIEFIKSKGMAVSVYFSQYLLEAMYLNKEDEHAISLLTSRSMRSWYNMLKLGSTITLEAWDDSIKPNQDWNHAWGAAPANIITRYILGVQPLSPGFEDILIAPQASDLAYVEGVVPTIKGAVSVKVENSPLSTVITLQTPGNTKASLRFPKRNKQIISTVSINGSYLSRLEIEQFDQQRLNSGQYVIEISYK